MSSEAKNFLDGKACERWLCLVREDGPGFMMKINPQGRVENIGFQNNAHALSMLTKSNIELFDLFVTPGRFSSLASRKAQNATDFSALFLDVDCGTKKAYANKGEALNALKKFCTKVYLPMPSLIINSGWGIHAYWSLKKPISKDEWKEAAARLKQLTKAEDFKADMAVTADPARVMRVPGSFNLKDRGQPKSVKIIHPTHQQPKRYGFKKLLARLEERAATKVIPSDDLAVSPKLMGLAEPEVIPQGERNSQLLRHAGLLRKVGFTQPQIDSTLLALNAKACRPSLSDSEVLDVARRYQDDSLVHTDANLFEGDTSQLSSMSEHKMIEALNQSYAWDLSQMQLYSIKTGRYVQKPNFLTQYSNKRVNKGTLEEPKLVELGKHWLSHPNRRDVPGVVMEPGKSSPLPNGAINAWKGYRCEPTAGDVEPFENLLKHLIPNDSEREYVLLWLASLIKNPASKFNVALVIWSYRQGTGKSLLFESIGRLFDPLHYSVVGQEVFTDGFTDWQANKVYVICDEVSSTGTRGASDRVKGWVTAQTNRINVKHEPKFEQPNLIKYVFLSNHPDAVFMEGNDRRFFVVEACQERLLPQQAKEYLKWFDNGGQSALLSYLLDIDTTSFNPAAPAPLTRSKQEMIDDNKSDLDRWLDAKLPELEDRQIELVSADGLSSEYAMSSGSPCSGRAIGLSLKKRGFTKLHKQARFQDGKRKRLYASKNVSEYERLSDGDLALTYEEQQSKPKKLPQEYAYSTDPQVV